MTSTFEWATYPRLLERNFFEWTKELYELEKQLHTPIPDSIHWTRRFEYPWILSKIPQPPKHYIDVGSGATALQFALTKRGNNITAIDPDPKAIEWINTRVPYFQLIRRSQAILGGFPTLPFKDDEFDTGICISVLEHLQKDNVLPSIHELLRVSRKEVLITMDIVIDRAHEVQTDFGDLEVICKKLNIPIQQPLNQQLTFQMDDHIFGVACLHITK